MRVLVVYCHPVPESFGAALRECCLEALSGAGHDTMLLDLYEENFDPVMSAEQRRHYENPDINSIGLEKYIDQLKAAEALVFVYPTWWFGLPAMLKGWLDRVFLPNAAFTLPKDGKSIQPMLQHIQKIGVVTTCGASYLLSLFVGQPGRKTLLRGLRLLCHPRCKTLYLAHYAMDASTDQSRKAYLARVTQRLRAF